jgi:hypothetical protein
MALGTPWLSKAAKKQIFCGGATIHMNYVGRGKCEGSST